MIFIIEEEAGIGQGKVQKGTRITHASNFLSIHSRGLNPRKQLRVMLVSDRNRGVGIHAHKWLLRSDFIRIIPPRIAQTPVSHQSMSVNNPVIAERAE